MTPWWLVTLGGALGSSHCVGMCGGFAALVALRRDSLGKNLLAQLVFSGGRLMSYLTLGALAGFTGSRLSDAIPSWLNIPALLCLGAGLFLIREGLVAAGWLGRRVSGTSPTGCLLRPMFSMLTRTPGASRTFVAGLMTGLLPCGLVYAYVSLAASTGDMLRGSGTMLSFGLGTVPLMVATGCFAGLLSQPVRRRIWRLAAWSVIATGVLTVGRGVAFLRTSLDPSSPRCPFCAEKESWAGQLRHASQ